MKWLDSWSSDYHAVIACLHRRCPCDGQRCFSASSALPLTKAHRSPWWWAFSCRSFAVAHAVSPAGQTASLTGSRQSRAAVSPAPAARRIGALPFQSRTRFPGARRPQSRCGLIPGPPPTNRTAWPWALPAAAGRRIAGASPLPCGAAAINAVYRAVSLFEMAGSSLHASVTGNFR